MRRMLLIRTNSPDIRGLTKGIVPPLGLMYLASVTRREFRDFYKIRIINMGLQNMKVKALEKILVEFKPNIIGCSVFSEEDSCMHNVAKVAKRLIKDCKVIVGGPHSTMYYSDILEDRNIDVAVVGEAERTFIELLRAFEDKSDLRKIRGIAFYENGKVIFTGLQEFIEDLDSLPFPAWDLIDIKAYSRWTVMPMSNILSGKKYMSIFTSRGCPYRCIYCYNTFGRRFRKRSPENVLVEIRELYNRYKIDEIHIFDDIFNFDKDRAKRICELIIDSGTKIKIAFPNALRGDLMDEDLLLSLKRAGTYTITYALETASPRLQKLINKNINIEKLNQIIDLSSRLGILNKCYFMLGFPTETVTEMKKTIAFACNSSLYSASFFIVRPQKGTRLFDLIKKSYPDFNPNFDHYNYYAADDNYKRILKLPIERIQRQAYRKFYLNIKRLMKLFILAPRKMYLFKSFLIFFHLNILSMGRKF